MSTFLLVIIYFAFISLGLPDAMLGAAWPSMRLALNLPLSGAGLISMIISAGTILSSLFSGRLIRRLGTSRLTTLSVLTTALSLLGFSLSRSYLWLCLIALPLGLGAGAVDAALNDFVARHYAARHMNWLHSFWGVGATAGPLIMAFMLTRTGVWQKGYRVVAIIQFALVGLLVFSGPLWPRPDGQAAQSFSEAPSQQRLLDIAGVKPALIGFFAYCAVETTAGLWGASFLVQQRGFTTGAAAGWVSAFYLGITFGRMINGFLSMRFASHNLIRLGQVLISAGGLLLLLAPLPALSLIGLLLVGLGCAPIFPSMLHETPHRFGSQNSTRLMGVQMAVAYMGTTFVPPLAGLAFGAVGLWLYPLILLALAVVMMIATERVNHAVAGRLSPTAEDAL